MANEPVAHFDCGRFEPMRTRVFVVEEDGRMITRAERRPRGKGMLMLDTYGNTNFFRTTNAISEKSERDPYGLQKLAEKTQGNAKWQTEPMIPFLSCPQQTEYEYRMPPHLRTGKRCKVASDGAQIGEDRDGTAHPCACMVALQAERRAKNDEIERNRDPKTTIQQALLNNAQQSTVAAQNATAKMTELLEQIIARDAAVAAAQPPGKGGGK